MDCPGSSTVVFSCTLKYSVLSLPAYLQTARTTMVQSGMVDSQGFCLSALGLKCTGWGGSHRAKGHTAIAAGGCFILAGVLCLVPASWFTNVVITSFLDSNVPESSKYEPGGAVYVTFVSAGFLLAAGVIFCLSCPGKREGQLDYTSSTDPNKLLQQQLRQEQLQRDQLQRDQLQRDQLQRERLQREQQQCREQQTPQEPASRDQLHRDKAAHEKLQADDLDEEKLPKDTFHHDQETQYYSPSRVPPKDARAGYSLQDYV